MSNFQKVIEFNTTFGNPVSTTIQKNLLIDQPQMVQSRLNLILEETNELKEAVEKKDMNEIIDALADILVVTYGMGSYLGIDLDKAYDIVHKSNMSKLCNSEEEAKETVEWYKKNESRYDSPNYKQSSDGKYWIVYNESTKKILKNIHYNPAIFDEMLKN
jgi:NTP pyrophosphatase (non-canonical NTP hydrolase)